MKQYLRVPRLDSIKSRILVLAVLGTLVPAGITLGVAYRQNRRALEDKITQDLVSQATQSARAVSVWLKERLYDLRVFASSDEVSTNLSRYASQGLASPRLREYLRSLHERFSDFEQLLVVDANGRVLGSSAQQPRAIQLPTDWQKTLRQEGQVVGNAYWDDKSGMRKLIAAVPVYRADGQLIGAFAAEINLAPARALLRSFSSDSIDGSNIYLVGESGVVLTSLGRVPERPMEATFNASTLEDLARHDAGNASYVGFEDRGVVGTLQRVPQARWSVVSEMSSDYAFARVLKFRNAALLWVVLVLLVVAGIAYRLGSLIVRPLERLAEGAAEVATGDLDVDLPNPGSAGEVGALTSVFNDMVSRLRVGRQELANTNEALKAKNRELEELSVTDGLTGLANHRALMQRLHEEGVRSQRSSRPFVVVMADVDHFKQYNDEFGHPEGDVVLKKVASILKESTRTVDCVGRYGGEEFAALLPETDMSGALEVAERMRSRIENAEFPGRRVTLSIGVAEFPKDADTPKKIIEVADAALYVAKRAGRNQVAQAKQAAKKQKLPTAKLPAAKVATGSASRPRKASGNGTKKKS